MAGYSAPPYEPAPNLHGGSFLTADQLVFNFQGSYSFSLSPYLTAPPLISHSTSSTEFYSNLVYLDCAPSYVFELLVGSVSNSTHQLKIF